jgi:RNA polymerase sigma-70 factor, ECF subfamily
MVPMSGAPELEALWRESSARLRAWFERETDNAADADDLLQETFVRVIQALGTLHDAERVRGWVASVARSVLVDHRRRRAVRDGAPSADEHAAGSDEGGGAGSVASPELEPDLESVVAGWLEAFLAELDPSDASALRLVDLEGRTHVELAARAGLSLSGAKSRVQRARARLRERLERCCALAFDARGGILDARRRADGRCAPGCGE